MMVLEPGMQHKLSTSWKSAYNTEYPVMAEDCIDTNNISLPEGINSTSAGSIVNGLLRKANGFGDGMCGGGPGGGIGLEQKIQELRAEKEAGEVKNCPTSIRDDQDSPIDFSVKRRPSFSGSLTDDSQASSSSPSHVTDYNASSPPANLGLVGRGEDVLKRGTPSPGEVEDQKPIGQPMLGTPPVNAMPPLLNGLNMFPGMPPSLLGNGSAMNAFSQMAAAAAFMDPRNKKNNRPFKAYPKEALQMPLGLFGMAGLTPASIQQGMDSGLFAGMNSEDLVNLYNQQLQLFREKPLSSPEQTDKRSPPSHLPTANGNSHSHLNPPHHHNQHHSDNHRHQHQHQNHHDHRLPPSPPHQPAIRSLSPSHHTPELVTHNHHTSSSSFPSPIPPPHASMNATLVSSTSSLLNSNSRKRPRSLPDEQKDAAYWERRRKNNDAAKRSRDARRAKEDEIAIRAALLEQENLKLRVEVAALKTETARLRCLLYNS